REGERVFAEVLGPPPRLLVVGAVDLAEELCRAAKGLGWLTVVADARARFATAERIPSADELLVAWPEEVLQQFEPDDRTAVIVLTHEDRWDVPALAGALASDALYIGALGSRRTQGRRREPLLETGGSADRPERLWGPAGLGLGAGGGCVSLRRGRHAVSRPARRLRDVQRRPQQPARPGVARRGSRAGDAGQGAARCLAAPGSARERAARARALVARARALHQLRHRGGRSGVEARPRGDRPVEGRLLRARLPWADAGLALGGGRRSLQRAVRTASARVLKGPIRRSGRARDGASWRRR